MEHVAIGTDVAYEWRFAAAERARVPKRGDRATPPAASPWEDLRPEGSPASRSGPSRAWTNWPLFTVGLVQRGHADEAIQRILGGNALRVARAVWENRT